tara:strand:- start:3978 stop:4193 length:216 start_codon:yes stop_codon:yes gene_type:complete
MAVRIWPTLRELIFTLAVTWAIVSMILAASYRSLYRIYEARWDEVVAAAKFNDFEGTGRGYVLIIYNGNGE